ncbi:pectate lyase-like adhesive domain-containing protein [Peribacillus butanolivorans]|uniref:pectate lyase-like adhesive domain-containing protein n=1 Tax=Peribacillus butanolivorans TaxID=421767 RepID=UPI0036A66CFB
MRKGRLTYKRRSRRALKDYSYIGVWGIILVIMLQQMNINGFFNLESAAAAATVRLSSEQSTVSLGDQIRLEVNSTIEEAGIISVKAPEGLAYDQDATRQSLQTNGSPPMVDYESAKKEITIAYSEQQIGENEVHLFFQAQNPGNFVVVAISDGNQSNEISINIEAIEKDVPDIVGGTIKEDGAKADDQEIKEEPEESSQFVGEKEEPGKPGQVEEEKEEPEESGQVVGENEKTDGVNVDAEQGDASIDQSDQEKEQDIEVIAKEEDDLPEVDPSNSVEGNIMAAALSADEIDVDSWDTFVAAVKNTSISKINLSKDIENPSASGDTLGLRTYQVTRDLEINGNGYRLSFKNSSIYLGGPTNGRGNFHMHDIVLAQSFAGAYSEDIVGSRLNASYTGKWKYRFGNITTEPSVQRLARAKYAEVTVYGEMNIDTRAENFYLGSFKMENGTKYIGNVNYYNFSIFYYESAARSGDTGESKEFTIGDESIVQLTQSQTTGTTYPAVYLYYKDITVGENAKLDINMPGNAVRFDDGDGSFTVKSGSYVNLTSKLTSGSVVAYNSSNNFFHVAPDAELYVIGNSSTPLINLGSTTSYRGNSFTLDNPKQYDLRNIGNNTAVGLGANTSASGYANTFEINESDIDLWKTGSNVLGPSDFSYAAVENFTATGRHSSTAGRQTVVSSEPALQSGFNTTYYRRIAGMNTKPILEFEQVTDADLTIKARVKIGEAPDNDGLDENGVVRYMDVYASENQASVDITDTHGIVHRDLKTDANGYVQYMDSIFNVGGQKMSGVSTRGPWVQDEQSETTVFDVTPPTPAEVSLLEIEEGTYQITGTADEVGATVLIEVDGDSLKDAEVNLIKTTVAENGTWTIDLPTPLAIGQTVQILLNDNTGEITGLSDVPITNNIMGNVNPTVSIEYHDAIFKAGPLFTVAEYSGSLTLLAPDSLSFGSDVQISPQYKRYQIESMNQKLGVQDNRKHKSTWKLKAALVDELYNSAYDSTLTLVYSNNGSDTVLSNTGSLIYEHLSIDDEPLYINDLWYGDTKNGLFVEAKAGEARVGEYEAKIKWSLEDTPVNE